MTHERNLDSLYREYLGKYTTMAIATVNRAGKLDCSTVYYAFDEKGTIYFLSDKSTSKTIAIAETGNFAAAMNDGGGSAMGVKISGKASEITKPEEILIARSTLATRIPHIEPFFENPNIGYYKLTPTKRHLINFSWGVDWRVEVI